MTKITHFNQFEFLNENVLNGIQTVKKTNCCLLNGLNPARVSF